MRQPLAVAECQLSIATAGCHAALLAPAVLLRTDLGDTANRRKLSSPSSRFPRVSPPEQDARGCARLRWSPAGAQAHALLTISLEGAHGAHQLSRRTLAEPTMRPSHPRG